MSDSVRVRVLRVAASMAGGPAKLRPVLNASAADLLDWLAGTTEPPEAVTLRALDFILDRLDAQD